jgi:hypothetical protein
MNDVLRDYLRDIAKKGGSAGRGASKRRGDADYYRDLAAKRRCPGRKGKRRAPATRDDET